MVVDANFDPGEAPVNELDGSLIGFDSGKCNGNVSTEEKNASHVRAVSRITFHDLVDRSRQALVISAMESCSW